MLPPLAAPSTSKSAAPSPLEPFAWLTGNWSAEVKMGNKSSKVLSRFTPRLSGRMMAMETSFDGEPLYEGMIGYDPAMRANAVWYVTPNGESIRGAVAIKDGDPVFDVKMTMSNGIELPFQTRVHRLSVDSFQWTLLMTMDKGATWNKFLEVEYHRLP